MRTHLRCKSRVPYNHCYDMFAVHLRERVEDPHICSFPYQSVEARLLTLLPAPTPPNLVLRYPSVHIVTHCMHSVGVLLGAPPGVCCVSRYYKEGKHSTKYNGSYHSSRLHGHVHGRLVEYERGGGFTGALTNARITKAWTRRARIEGFVFCMMYVITYM